MRGANTSREVLANFEQSSILTILLSWELSLANAKKIEEDSQ